MTETAPQTDMAAAARAAGASLAACTVIRAEQSDGFMNRTVRSHYDHERDKVDADSLPGSHGHYVTALWDGRVGDAYAHADGENTGVLLRTFPEDYLVEAVIRDLGWSEDAARDTLARDFREWA